MLTFWKANSINGRTGTVTSFKEPTTKDDDDDDMAAALSEMRTYLQNGMATSASGMSTVWSTNNVSQTSGSRLLLSKLESVQILLLESYNFFQSHPPQPSDDDESSYSVTSVCISDNYRRLKQKVKIIRKYLESDAKLPMYRNLPRIYVIAQEIVYATGGNFDIELLVDCLKRFQRNINLNLEELWTIPVMLQLVIVEYIAINAAGAVMNSILLRHSKEEDAIHPRDLNELLSLVKNVDLSDASEREFLSKVGLQIEENLIDFVVVVVPSSHCIGCSGGDLDISFAFETLALLSSLEWEEIGFVEQLSVIDRVFEKSSCSSRSFQLLDRSTKNRYRSAVHQIVTNSSKSEEEVAQLAVKLSGNDFGNATENHRCDIGYYLIDDGLHLLQKMCVVKLSAARQFQQYLRRTISIFHYIKAILFVSITLSVLFHQCFGSSFSSNRYVQFFVFVCAFLTSTQWSSEVINYLATKLVTPNLLPRFDFSRTGIPKKFRTIVVIPCLISNFESINSLISKLEIRFVGNKDENLDFALLTDFEDSNEEKLFADQPLLDHLNAKISNLNEKYSKIRSSIFYAFHRPRVFNAVDNIWMGYERKRPKLAAFANYLRGIETEKFSFVAGGDISKLQSVKYVITLDTDTSLPRDVARKLVGAMAHPLNRPTIDRDNNRSIRRGYGISHDLLEGNYLRTGFLGDIQLYEDFPQSFISDLTRRHRWIRGDWQNIDYFVDANSSALSKWKIFDNLRRSLIPIAELLTILLHWQEPHSILFLLGMRLLFSLLLQDSISFSKLFSNFNRKSKLFFQ